MGLLQHYWVAVKLVLTVAVPATAVQLGDRLVAQSMSARLGPGVADAVIRGVGSAPTLLVVLSVAHLLMLGVATVLSVYKPWGLTWFGRRASASAGARRSAGTIVARLAPDRS